jgi:hypothetical protein
MTCPPPPPGPAGAAPPTWRPENPLQRVLRDLLVAQQDRVIADVSYDALGQALVGPEG